MSTRAAGIALVLAASPALATPEDEVQATYRGLCQLTQTCMADGACGTTPAVGQLLLEVRAGGTWMGQTEATLAPIDHYASLQDALPLPRHDTRRRTFLTDLSPEGRTRRFAVRVQRPGPEAGDPVLRPRYFVLSCEAL